MLRKVLSDVLGHASWVRANASSDEGLMPAAASSKRFHLPVVVSLAGHALLLILFLLASWNYVTQMPLYVAAAPLPPPAPDPPPEMTDPRVFLQSPALYSSLPLRAPHG